MKMKPTYHFIDKSYYFQKVHLKEDTELIVSNQLYDKASQFQWTEFGEDIIQSNDYTLTQIIWKIIKPIVFIPTGTQTQDDYVYQTSYMLCIAGHDINPTLLSKPIPRL